VTAVLSAALFTWGAIAGAENVMGVVAGEGSASIVVSDQPDGDRTVTITKVVAPADAFVVIHQSDGGMPGKRLGYARVDKGLTRNVKIELEGDAPLTPELLAAVHIDRGTPGELEFDMENIDRSPDTPFFVNGAEVAQAFKAAEFGVPVKMGEAVIEAGEQPLGESVTVVTAVAPSQAFVVVHKAKADGMPGERVGYAPIDAGSNANVKVKLDTKLEGKTKLIAAIHVDADGDGELEFDMEDPVASPDQPFFAAGMEVAVQFTVGPFGVKTDEASIEATDQIGAGGTLAIDTVDAPQDSWVVVHKDAGGAPGDRIGLVRVKAGVTKDVRVELTAGTLPESLIVALHADLGDAEVFDFDMMNKLDSPDQPYFVDGDEVAAVVKVREFGYATPAGSAAIAVTPQVVTNGLLRVDTAAAPEGAWVVVHLDAGGMPGGRVGLVHIPAGVTQGIVVQLDASQKLTDALFVAVHADRGEVGLFEFDMMDRVNSSDQPFFVDGAEVAAGVTIR
jgi:hypothetical protein